MTTGLKRLSRNSEFIRHAPCPSCGSKDNLGIYNDHEYCFGCGHRVIYGSRHRNNSEQSNAKATDTSKILALPDDCEPYYPAIALDWLSDYELTQNELFYNNVLWSESRKLLIFPYFGEDTKQLLGWQGRYFGDNPNHPKWFTKGFIRDFIKVVNLQAAQKYGIIYVEDIISAIKIGRQYGSCPIFGSHIPLTHTIRLGKLGIRNFYIWLDSDKYKEAHKFCRQITNLGYKCKVIFTDKDPKYYNNIEIYNYINNIERN